MYDDKDEPIGEGGDEQLPRGKQPSTQDPDALYLTLKQWFVLDDAHSQEWRKDAKAAWDFVAGDQWPKLAIEMMGKGRQPLVFNFTGPFIRAVAGLEIGTRHDVTFLPREVEEGDIQANEMIGTASDWMGDQCHAPHEQSDAFHSTLVTGMGFTEARMAFDEGDKDGKYIEERIDEQEMRWDRSARKPNLMDSRRMWRIREMTLDEARDMFPDEQDGDLNASFAMSGGETEPLQSVEERRLKLENSVPYDPASQVYIVQCQWIERECYYLVAMADGMQEMSEADYETRKKEAEAVGVQLPAAKQYRKVFKQAWLGGKILGKVANCPDPKRFTLRAITGMPHRTKGTWYGLVRLMKDPAMNLNKWLSQALHILNTTAKGGVIAERGAFRDLEEAKRTYADPQAITEVEKGAISGNKIMGKPGTGLAAPYVQLVDFAQKAIPAVTGIPLEMLGTIDRNQPGIVEAQRKHAGMTVLAQLFDNLKLYRLENGHTRLYYIQRYMPDGKMLRIVGKSFVKAVRFLKDKTMGQYDVQVEDAPTSPDEREQTWTRLMQMAQTEVFAQLLQRPEIASEVLDYCPLPTKVVSLLKKGVSEPPPGSDQERQMLIADAVAKIKKLHAEAGKIGAETGKVEADTQLSRAGAILKLADAGVKQQEARNMRAEQVINDIVARIGMPPSLAPPATEEFAVQDITPNVVPEMAAIPAMTEAGAPYSPM